MAFLFKSKKNQAGTALPAATRNIASADGTAKPAFSANGERSRLQQQAALNGSTSSLVNPNPDLSGIRQRSGSDLGQHTLQNLPVAPSRPPPDLSLYPWSQSRLEFVSGNPFPRYGAAVNALASKEGEVYMMGGLINGTTVKGDLWLIEASNSALPCYSINTASNDGPGPRVGHASLLVGNAFIIFGGDTKVEDGDILDDTLYLLNTATKQWSKALPAGPRPAGRYGHTLNMLGTKIYVFGGQVEGFFFNDLVAFDLNALQAASNRWETLIQNTDELAPPGLFPPARTNHTVISWNDKLYLFGGTNGVTWFNDVWAYDPRTNSWAQQECIGFIPTAREGHAAALVGDVMYIFGGRTKDGIDLGDLTAFRLSTRRWYTFHNMGPSPSPRSGHSMTAIGNKIVVLAGEPSSSTPDPLELSQAYILDTDKIRYPNDQPAQQLKDGRKSANGRGSSEASRERSSSREGVRAAGSREDPRLGTTPADFPMANQTSGSPPSQNGWTATPSAPRTIRASPAPTGPPPQQPNPLQQQQQPPQMYQGQPNGIRPLMSRNEGRESPRPGHSAAMVGGVAAAGAVAAGAGAYLYGRENSTRSPQMDESGRRDLMMENAAQQGSPPSNRGLDQSDPRISPIQRTDSLPIRNLSQSSQPKVSLDNPYHNAQEAMSPAAIRALQQTPNKNQGVFPVDSGIGSSPALVQQNDELLRELDAVRNKNAWYASELSLARKAGYQVSTPDNSLLDERNADTVSEDERPFLEALLSMRTEIANLQGSLESQAQSAAERIAQVEQQRDSAIAEAMYAKTRLAASGGSMDGTPQTDEARSLDDYRSNDVQRRLAATLQSHNDLTGRLSAMAAELEAERNARQLAEDNADAAHSRAEELDTHKQQSASELEQLRAELHDVHQAAREHEAASHEATTNAQMLEVDKRDLTDRLTAAQAASQNHSGILATLEAAILASQEKSTMLERQLDTERQERGNVEDKLAQLKSEHEQRVTELESAHSRLRDAEETASSHANEAEKHRAVVLAGFGQMSAARGLDSSKDDERVSVLQERLENANALVKSNKDAADRATERLRRAEERIAGLETYQEQASREGLSLRKQLQSASKDSLSLRSELAEMQQHLANEKLNSTALDVQHGALKNLLSERGISTDDLDTAALQHTSMDHAQRLQDLEQQLDASSKAHDDMRALFEQRELEANKGWEAKLSALDNDYQAAVKYLKGTEKMLAKMKQELQRQKNVNKELEEELGNRSRSIESGGSGSPAPADWESQRSQHAQQLEDLQSRVTTSQALVDQHAAAVRTAQAERDAARATSTAYQQQLSAAQQQSAAELESLRAQNRALEAKAAESESRVQMLLDNVGASIRRHSRNISSLSGTGGMHGGGLATLAATAAAGHRRGTSNTSSAADSLYSGGGAPGVGDEDDDDAAARNSLALDSLANELETLRSHWETSKSYRMSGGSDFVNPLSTATAATSNGNGASSGAAHANPEPAMPGSMPGGLPGGMI